MLAERLDHLADPVVLNRARGGWWGSQWWSWSSNRWIVSVNLLKKVERNPERCKKKLLFLFDK